MKKLFFVAVLAVGAMLTVSEKNETASIDRAVSGVIKTEINNKNMLLSGIIPPVKPPRLLPPTQSIKGEKVLFSGIIPPVKPPRISSLA